MGYPYSMTYTVSAGDTILAAHYNTANNEHINNNIPESIDDYSANATEMKATADPYPAGSESLATTLDGELQRIRYVINQILKSTQWYIFPDLVTKTTTYTATLADRIILCSTAGGAWSLTLPAASGNTDKTYYIKKTTGDAYALTIDGNASETIDGSTTLALSTQYDSVLIACDGSNWHTLAQKDADLGTLSNVVEDTTPQLGGFLDANGNYMQTEKGGDIASASPLVIDTDGDYFDVTGTTGFAAMTVVADRQFTLQFDGALTMTHHATNLDLPGESNITTAAGDVAIFQSTGSNTVQCISYVKADGTAVVGGSAPEGTTVLSTGEGGGTKFLREDGDGTSSWQTAPVTSVSGSTGAVADGDIDHDSLANFAANEHFTQANITATGTVASGTWQGTAVDGTYVDLEGTELKSTGEAGGTKFLREDSDGTCSWQTPPVTSVSGSTGAVADGDIDHDSLANFAANEHYTQANITATGTVASGVWQGTAIDGTYIDLEGTEVKSTGEAGGTKYLKEDGDGTSSWQSAPAPEGTAVLSTGEAGGTKFLREDGDGSCSWQTGSGGGSYDSIGTNDILITKITIDENITFGGTDNGLSIGPLSIANGYTVSVVNGTRWLVL